MVGTQTLFPWLIHVAAVGFTGSMNYRLLVPLLVARVRSPNGYIDADVSMIIWLSVTKNFRTQITSVDLTSGLAKVGCLIGHDEGS
jgi:hypothetical protein